MNSNDTRSPEEIEADIEHTRHELDDTLDAIQHKFTPGQWVDEAARYFRSGPGEFGENLAATVKQNPLPVLLIGTGVAWLIASGSQPAQRSNYPVPAGPVYRSRESLDDGHSPRVRPQYGAAGEEHEGLRDKAGHMAAGARRTGESVRESAADLATGAREKMHQWSDEAGYQAQVMADEARFRAERARAEAYYRARRTRGGFLHMLDEQPLVLGALGVALGAALGASFPGTRREDEWLGESRDEMLHRARDYGEEQVHRAERVAQAAGDAALDEAHREGLSPEAGREAVDRAKEKVEQVSEAAKEAAASEAGTQGFATPSHHGGDTARSGTGTHTTGGVATPSAGTGLGGTGVTKPGLGEGRTGSDGTPGSARPYGS